MIVDRRWLGKPRLLARLSRALALSAAACLLASCASGPASERRTVHAWPLALLSGAPGDRVALIGEGHHRWLALAPVRTLEAVSSRLFAVSSGEAPALWITSETEPNAMAFRPHGQAVIAVTVGMLSLLGDDADAWAVLVGHELAHLRLGHQQRAESRHADVQASSGLAGVLLAVVGVPFASAVADSAGAVVERGFSRDDEREADRVGLEYARLAGYSPEGGARLFARLADAGSGRDGGLLSTHPGIEERVRTAEERTRSIQAGAVGAAAR